MMDQADDDQMVSFLSLHINKVEVPVSACDARVGSRRCRWRPQQQHLRQRTRRERVYPRTPATAPGVVVPPRAALPEKRVVSPLHEGEKTKVADGARQFSMKAAPAVCSTNMQKSSHSVTRRVSGSWWCHFGPRDPRCSGS